MAKKRDIYTMSNGKEVTEGSVSQLCGILDKPALVGWAAKMTVHALGGKEAFPDDVHEKGLWLPDTPYSAQYIDLALQEAKGAHRKKKDTAGDLGTEVHLIVGAYVEGQLKPEDIADKHKRKALENFIETTKDWEWLGSEVTLINEWCECGEETTCANLAECPTLKGYGGTADAIARINGDIHLIDFKTSNSVQATYSMQCALYARATPVGDAAGLAELWQQIEEARILHFNKEFLTWESLERNIKEHYPYIPHFIGCRRWAKRFEVKSASTYEGKLKITEPKK